MFSGAPGAPATRAHFELHTLSLEKRPPITNPRLWVGLGVQAGTGPAALAVIRRRRRKAYTG